MNNTKKIVEITKKKSEEKKEYVLEVINSMIRNEEKITFYSVYKKAGVSKSFVYNNNEIRNRIELCRNGSLTKDEVKDNKDILIDELNKEIDILTNKLKEYKKDELWKVKYENKKKEASILRERLERLFGEQY
ncbi:transposase [Clostridium botulinum]|nr:transposase [Clostridium botulinum]NFM04080.1 transposase [Clostridium botulinum]